MGLNNDRLTSELFPSTLSPVMLRGPTDLHGFRRAARSLLARQVPPEQVFWHTSGAPVRDLFSAPGSTAAAANAEAFRDAPSVKVPAGFMALCERVILHRDRNRFGLLYRIFWRLAHEPGLRHDPLDPDRLQAGHMAQAVRRDLHKMKAFVRFRSVQDEQFRAHPEDGPLHMAWFEPEHHIVEAVAPFFARRFTQMRWAILTPACSVEWDCVSSRSPVATAGQPRPVAQPVQPKPAAMAGQLRFGPGAKHSDAPSADAGEQLWLTYYQHTFSPARLKMKAMQKEMPRKYWRNLPGAQLIGPLAAMANERTLRIIAQPATVTHRRLPARRKALASSAEKL
ncbi:TIGR03915 family putative DNA repair protein [Polaromonas sp. CG_9.11]|uniref:TIGR03915 family putative DNA repair protein n=1 Tax=Polaromonas sp. CG_9.11 TaxID=2787730 RepID=UPI001A2B66B4|nr:TIGR03915 family putative DNA repair protein [Polaromonas sp. CG_9.11]MBG6078077.1 DNA polymerase [Polaromonas sp. CG_9.11]